MTSSALLTIDDVKRELRVSTATVFNLLADGQLPRIKVRSRTFVRTADLAAFIERSVSGGMS
jgi:hypothetical protein